MTTISRPLAQVDKLFVDTSPLIYFVERHPVYLPLCRNIFERMNTGELSGVTGVVTLTEVLTVPLRTGNTVIEKLYRDILVHSRNFTLLMVDTPIAERAAQLRALYNLRTADALQMGAALMVGCQAFLTNDAKLMRVTELRVLLVDDLELDPL
jgi:predicted nucleic acid-binding protein